MKTDIRIKEIISAFLAAAAVVSSCDVDDAADIPLVELGANGKEYVVEAEASTVEIPVFSNGAYHIERTEDTDWLELDSWEGNGDGTVTASCSFNEEFKRMTGIVLCSDVDSRRDTVYIKQKGLMTAVLSKENTSIIADGAGGKLEESVITNVPFSYFTVEKVFPEGADSTWIESIDIPDSESEERVMSIVTAANPDEINPRTATIYFSYTDGWGDKVALSLNIVQRNAKEGIGREVSIKDVMDNYATGKEISDYIIIEGYVVSNTDSGNAGENEQITTSAIDYNGSKTTVYLEALDGSCGVALITATPADNSFNQFDKVQILLHGATAVFSTDPDRVTIKNVTKNMIVSQIAGTKGSIPVKEKYMNELTDSDVYTYVTLKDVEFPVRKGAITPVNEGYAIGTNASRLSKYPLLVRDINGDHLYMYTNTVCLYRNDGTRLPYGSGKISGVVVHERFSRFEWRDGADPVEIEEDVELGNIGRYQIRHQCKEDIWGQMNDSVEDSFSALLTEYRFWNPDKAEEVCRPTYGENGWFTHTYQEKYTGSEAKEYTLATYNQHMWGAGTYEYLGPMGNNVNYMFGMNLGNKNGIGIVLDPAKEHYNADMSSLVSFNPDGSIEWCGPNATNAYATSQASGINYGSSGLYGKSNVSGNCFTAFASHYWWDYDNNRPYGWLLNFSTAGISTSHISLQISVLNTEQKWYAPRFWKAEWSTTDSQAAKDDSRWNLIGEYTVPDVSVWSNTLYSSIVAYKGINFELPQEILGKENVYIRLVPVNDLCSNGADYANARLMGGASETNHSSAIEYIAIRYNK